MSEIESIEEQTPFYRLVHGHYGLAATYWVLFLLAAAGFFVTGSLAVSERDWLRLLVLVILSVGWTFLLLMGVKRGYRGNDPGKAIARVSMLFLTLNLTNTLAVLSFF